VTINREGDGQDLATSSDLRPPTLNPAWPGDTRLCEVPCPQCRRPSCALSPGPSTFTTTLPWRFIQHAVTDRPPSVP
jgi:hypothetical protein